MSGTRFLPLQWKKLNIIFPNAFTHIYKKTTKLSNKNNLTIFIKTISQICPGIRKYFPIEEKQFKLIQISSDDVQKKPAEIIYLVDEFDTGIGSELGTLITA